MAEKKMDISRLDLDDNNEPAPVWCEFQGGMLVLVSFVPDDVATRLRKKCITRYQGRGQEIVENFDAGKFARLLGRESAHDWKNVVDGEKEIPYSPETCDKLITRWTDFSVWLMKTSTDLNVLNEEALRKLMEDVEKKSESTSGQEETSRE